MGGSPCISTNNRRRLGLMPILGPNPGKCRSDDNVMLAIYRNLRSFQTRKRNWILDAKYGMAETGELLRENIVMSQTNRADHHTSVISLVSGILHVKGRLRMRRPGRPSESACRSSELDIKLEASRLHTEGSV